MIQSNLNSFVSISVSLKERGIIRKGKNIPDSRKRNKPLRVNTRDIIQKMEENKNV